MIRPEASLPALDPSVDVVTYHASTSARVEGDVSCESIDLEVKIKRTVSQSICQNMQLSLEKPERGNRDLLFNTSKRTKISTGDTDNTQDGGEQQDPEILEDGEDEAAHNHQERSSHQHPPSADAVGDQRQERAEEYITQQRQRHEDSNLVV